MRTRTISIVLGLVLAMAALHGRAAVATAARGGDAPPLDLKRYMPVAQVKPGMTGVGRTTLQATTIVEFKIEVLAVLKKFGPKRDLIICRCSGAGLEQSGVVAGMSGSPVYIDGRLIGAVAYTFRWSKVPIAGVQPIEQMLGVTDAFPWQATGPAQATGPVATFAAVGDEALTVPASALASADVPEAFSDRGAYQMRPIHTPVMVSGLTQRAMARLGEHLEPFGMVPMQGGAAELDLPDAARLEPGAPLAIAMVRGDVEMTTMGTITEVVGDRLYGFGHAMFGFGEANYPMMTGVAKVVVPTLMSSFRMGAPSKEIGRLVWDEQTGILGRIGNDRAPLVPVTVKVTGPGRGAEQTFRAEMVHHQRLSQMFAATVAGSSLTAHSDLPPDHTVAYRIRVKPEGRDPIVHDNLAVSPNGDAYIEMAVRSIVGQVMENAFQCLAIESVEVEAAIEAGSRLAEIEKSRLLRNTVRPGGTVPVELKIRPWREEPRWITVDVKVPDDWPEGKYALVLCSADEALKQEMLEAPVRFAPDDIESLLAHLARGHRRDRLFIRLSAPGQGIAIGRDELPNLPATMRSVLMGSARRKVTGVTGSLVTTRPMEYVLRGGRRLEITVDRQAPEP
ncbi:MAG: hypothetical protein AMK72_07020 [Planctomycetes bacterium SM23_25]|nr:MAG: hypothetical protein AMK72_07020 [Planctomycetes bacterium SM23_25]